MSDLAVDMTERLLPAAPAVARPTPSDGQTRSLVVSAWLVALSSFMWGYGGAVLNVCIVPNAVGSLVSDINLSTAEQETATALVVIGAMVSAVTTGGVGDRIGLKKTILLNNAFFVAGGVICALAITKRAIFIGRTLIGLASGIVTNTVPILLNEISPVRARGQITSLHQLSLTIGNLFTGLLGYYFVTQVPSGWRWLNAFMIVPPLLQCAAMAWIPESPWWLMKHHGREETLKVLRYLRDASQKGGVDEEMQDIARIMEHRGHVKQVTWSHLLAHKQIIVMGSILVFFQAMTGINTVMLYSAKIFHFAGVTDPFLATTIVGIVNVGVTIISVKLVDSYGRRPLLLLGTTVMIVALLVLSWSLLYLNTRLETQGAVAVISVLFFVAGFAVGLGAVVWVILGDITPVHIRTRAFSFYMGVSYICNIVIAVGTLSAISYLGRGTNREKNGIAKLYLILSGVAILALAYIFSSVEETSHIKTAPSKSRGSDEENGLLREDRSDSNSDFRAEVTEL